MVAKGGGGARGGGEREREEEREGEGSAPNFHGWTREAAPAAAARAEARGPVFSRHSAEAAAARETREGRKRGRKVMWPGQVGLVGLCEGGAPGGPGQDVPLE